MFLVRRLYPEWDGPAFDFGSCSTKEEARGWTEYGGDGPTGTAMGIWEIPNNLSLKDADCQETWDSAPCEIVVWFRGCTYVVDGKFNAQEDS